MNKGVMKSGWILILVFMVGVSTCVRADGNERHFSVSGGYGIPYGHIGFNLEVGALLPVKLHHINHYFSFTLGAGMKKDVPLFAMGFNGYPLGRQGLLQPRLSFYYAKVDRILVDEATEWSEADYDTIEALCLGGGLGFKVGKALTLWGDALYLIHIYDDIDADEIGGQFKFALGARFDLETMYDNQSPVGTEANNPSFMQVGFGLGIPYGGVGINLEFSPLLPGQAGRAVNQYSSVCLGNGITTAGSAYSLGLRVYPAGKEKVYRPRIGIHAGTVAMIEWYGGDSTNLEGLAVSGGLLYKIGDHWAIDGDLVYIATVFGWDLDDLDSAFKVSFGLRLLL